MRLDRKLLCCIEQSQLKFLGHVMHKGELEDLAVSGRIPRKQTRVASVLHLFNNFKRLCIYICILGNYGRLHIIEHNGKTSKYIEDWIIHDTEEREIFIIMQKLGSTPNVDITEMIR